MILSHWNFSDVYATEDFSDSVYSGGSLFTTRKYPRSLVYLPSTTSSDIVASPSLATSPDCRTAHKALQSHVNLSLGRLPHPSWSRRPGRPRGRWIDQIRNDTIQTPADLWRQGLGRGHHGRATRRPMLAMRWWLYIMWLTCTFLGHRVGTATRWGLWEKIQEDRRKLKLLEGNIYSSVYDKSYNRVLPRSGYVLTRYATPRQISFTMSQVEMHDEIFHKCFRNISRHLSKYLTKLLSFVFIVE